jgi:subtilisin family serine protease
MEEVIDSVRAAGILVVASAGNSGPACGTIDTPPGMYAASFVVGASGATSDDIAGFSSRGPTPVNLLKPDVTAPGENIRSSVTGNAYGNMSGTSMAGPHVAGVAALLMSANPALRRDPAAVEAILRHTSVPLPGQTCGTYPGSTIPNTTYGHGRIDAWTAFRAAETIFVDAFE